MLKISIIDVRNQRRLALEGRLAAPWTEVLKTACQKANTDLEGRELVIDLINVTSISQPGENLLLELMEQGIRFHGCGVFTKEILRQLARRLHGNGVHS